jgi:hypothetical protein
MPNGLRVSLDVQLDTFASAERLRYAQPSASSAVGGKGQMVGEHVLPLLCPLCRWRDTFESQTQPIAPRSIALSMAVPVLETQGQSFFHSTNNSGDPPCLGTAPRTVERTHGLVFPWPSLGSGPTNCLGGRYRELHPPPPTASSSRAVSRSLEGSGTPQTSWPGTHSTQAPRRAQLAQRHTLLPA